MTAYVKSQLRGEFGGNVKHPNPKPENIGTRNIFNANIQALVTMTLAIQNNNFRRL